jgi:hypothetical protein
MDDEDQNGAIRRSRPCFLVWGFVLFVVTFGVTPEARGTSYTIVTAPEEADGEGKGINDSGQIVGFTAGANPQGFLSSGGSLTPISVPGALDTKPFDINNAGQIVGSNVLAFNGTQGFLYSGGHFTTISVPGAVATDARGLNDAGRSWEHLSSPRRPASLNL